MDIQLLLVDLDNLVPRGHSLPMPTARPRDDPNWLRTQGELDAPRVGGTRCIVAFAFNLETATRPGVSYAGLRALAQRLATLVAGAPLASMEIGLTLTVKQAADKALERLLLSAPDEGSQGLLEAVHAISDDKGFLAAIRGALRKRNKYDELHEVSLCSWIRRKGAGARRRFQRVGEMVATIGTAPTDPCTAISTPQLAAWASTQTIDLPEPLELPDLARRLPTTPGVLTQIGITKQTVRGVARMGGLARRKLPRIGECDPADGLELLVRSVADQECSRHGPSALGPGAVRFQRPPATVCTQLPPRVLSAIPGPIKVGVEGSVVDKIALRRVDRDDLAMTEPCKVEISVRAHGLVARMRNTFCDELEGWWWPWGKDVGSELTLRWQRGEERLVPTSLVTVEAVPTIGSDTKLTLDYLSPLAGPTDLMLDNAIESEQLGRARDGHRHFAVLAPLGGCAAGTLRCRPIQELDPVEWQVNYPKLLTYKARLCRLPLVSPG